MISLLTPRGLHTASLGFAAKVTKEKKITLSVGQNSIYFPGESVKGWDTSQKRLKTTAFA